MQELELNGHQYRTGRLSAFDQFHVFRKLAPLFSGMGETFVLLPQEDSATIPAGFWKALEPVSQSLADMSREDSEFVIRTCLKVVTRINELGRPAPVLAGNGGDPMFDDIDMLTMMSLTFAVVQDNFASFFGGAAPNGSGGATLSP